MRSDRLPRALLRLYPYPWRERYGDEFLALIADSGLSWRGVLDVVAAAAVERARDVWRLARYAGDPEDPLEMNGLPTRSWSDVFIEGFTLTGIIAAVAVALVFTAGVQPPWNTWFWVLLRFWSFDAEPASYLPRRVERIVAKAFWIGAAMVVAVLILVIAALLRRAGLPDIPPRLLIALGVTVITVGLLRAIYCMHVDMVFGSRWRGMSQTEIRGWNIAAFALAVMVSMSEPDPRMFWPLFGSFWVTLKPPFSMTRAGAEHRMKLHDVRRRADGWG